MITEEMREHYIQSIKEELWDKFENIRFPDANWYEITLGWAAGKGLDSKLAHYLAVTVSCFNPYENWKTQ